LIKESPEKSSQSCNQANQGSDNVLNYGPDNLQHGDLTRRIIGCAMQVHSALGNGFQEVIYQRALEIEMRYGGLKFEREKEMPIFYRDENIGTRRVDFFVENMVMVELKAVIKLEDVHLAQAMNYLEAYGMKIGLLLNFGSKSLEFKRVHKNTIER
jgi:GxxExxY protein